MSEVNGKPDAPEQTTAPAGTDAQPTQPEQPANPTVEASDAVKSYLKGLGLESAPISEELIKVAEAGIKQKASVSKLSLEKEQLLAQMTSRGEEPQFTEPEPEKPAEPTPPATPATPTQEQTTKGVTANDLFDLSMMIQSSFPELVDEAQDGRLFKDLRQRGYFSAAGINKKDIYDYLSQRNADAKELRELREFKAKYSQPNPNTNPAYTPKPGVDLGYQGEMTKEFAHNLVMSGQRSNKRYGEALEFLRKDAMGGQK